MKTNIKCRQRSRSWSPRYDIRIPVKLYQRIRKLGSFERRKFRTYVRQEICSMLDHWEKENSAPLIITPRE